MRANDEAHGPRGYGAARRMVARAGVVALLALTVGLPAVAHAEPRSVPTGGAAVELVGASGTSSRASRATTGNPTRGREPFPPLPKALLRWI